MPISSHLGIVLKAVQDGGVQIGSLPGVSFTGLRNGADIADHFRRLRPKFRRRDTVRSTLYHHRMAGPLHVVDKTSFHDVGDLPCILFCGIPQEYDKA